MVDTVVVEVPGQTGRSTNVSGTSWGAILGGAFVIVAITLLLLAMGAGFGLSPVSPWPGVGVSATTFAVMTAIWLVIVQWISSGIGGYIAGRLRTRWTGLHTHEVHFRITAYGILAWAVAVVLSAAVPTGVASGLVGSAATVASGAAQGAAQNPATTYRLIRSTPYSERTGQIQRLDGTRDRKHLAFWRRDYCRGAMYPGTIEPISLV